MCFLHQHTNGLTLLFIAPCCSFLELHIRVYKKYPSLLAEMYAYSMAAAHTNLPHFTLHNLMVSNVHAGDEGWKWIDQLEDDVCEPAVNGVYYPGKTLPAVLHFCQFYRAGEIGFQKRRIKKELFSCDQPMMMELPRDLGKVNYKNRDGEVGHCKLITVVVFYIGGISVSYFLFVLLTTLHNQTFR